MEHTVEIRKASMEDLDTIYGFISHLEEYSFDAGKFRERYSGNLKDDNCIYLVAVIGGNDCIGFISSHVQRLLHHETPVFEIQEMYVSKNHRNSGIGKSLINALEERIKET